MLDSPVVIHTATGDIQPVPTNPGAYTQTLLSGDDITGFVQIIYGPPGFTPAIRGFLARGPHRHYHRTVRERHYVLGGDYPVWHWENPAALGTHTKLRRHHYIENPPVTLHGISPDWVPQTGYKILQWTDGYGTDLTEPEAATETFDVGFDGEGPDLPFDRPILFHAEDAAWMPHPTQPGWQIKPLSGSAPNLPEVALINVPQRSVGEFGNLLPSNGETSWCFVISGDLKLDIGSGDDQPGVILREGGFIAWANERFPTAGGSDGGCVVLCAGHRLDGG
jgi:hypothetical protein